MEVPQLDLQLQYKRIREEIEAAVLRVCASQRFILGEEVERFEEEIARYLDCKFALGISSGTDALLLALMALQIGAGDEVITTAFSFFATAGSIARTGATPVFVDIEPDTFNIDPAQIARHITTRTKAIIPVHLYGQPAEMDGILAVAKEHEIAVIEDAAQAIGAEYRGKKAGTLGTMGCYSFFPSKNLGGFGDGGLLTTNDVDLFARLKSMRVHGQVATYVHKYVGGNFRLDALQAAILRVKLKYLEKWTKERENAAAAYCERFKHLGLFRPDMFGLPVSRSWNRHVFNQFTVTLENRSALRDHLKARNIGVQVYYPLPLHLQECFHNLGYSRGTLPVSESAAEKVLSLPLFPELSQEQISFVVDQIAAFFHA